MGKFQRIKTAEEGTTLVEMAIIVPIFLTLVFCVIEYGLIMFTKVAMESATTEVGRFSSLATSTPGCDRVCQVRALIQQKTMGLINGNQVVITANLVTAGGAPPAPDICMTSPPSTPPVCPVGIMWQDENGNGVYDGPGSVSLGNPGDLVELRASFPWKVQFPFIKYFFGERGVITISASTVIKNEP